MSLHVVQIGHNPSVFYNTAPSNTRERQRWYAAELERISPGARMTYVVLSAKKGLQPQTIGNLTLLPIHASSSAHIPRVFLELRRLHKSHPINAISPQDVAGWGWMALAFGRTHGIPVVGQIHYDLFSPAYTEAHFGRGWRGRMHYRMILWLLKQFAALRVVSTSVARKLEGLGLTCPIEVIPVSNSTADNSPVMPAESVLNAKPESNLILYVGRLVPEKDLFTWLRVASLVVGRMPEVIFRMVGGGSLSDAIAAEATRLGVNEQVEMIGPLPPTELQDHYRQASVLLLTSRSEGFGRVIVEGMFAGVVPVASRISGPSDIIKHAETGFLHDQEDVKGMAESVARLLMDTSLRRSMALAALKDARERFDTERLIQKWVNFLVTNAQPTKGDVR